MTFARRVMFGFSLCEPVSAAKLLSPIALFVLLTVIGFGQQVSPARAHVFTRTSFDRSGKLRNEVSLYRIVGGLTHRPPFRLYKPFGKLDRTRAIVSNSGELFLRSAIL